MQFGILHRVKLWLYGLASGSPTLQRLAYEIAFEGLPRPFDKYCKKHFNGRDPIAGVEIGVFEGLHAESLDRILHPKKLFLVDPYMTYDEGQIPGAVVELARQEAHKRLSSQNVTFLRCKSTEADLTGLDFIYLDGDHSYEAVKADLDYWWPRLNNGGVIGGHDFGSWLGVVRAVTEWAAKNNLQLHCETPDWWVVKGGV
jgi:hypothetical protein